MSTPTPLTAAAADEIALRARLAAMTRRFEIPGIAVALVAGDSELLFTDGEDAAGSGRPVDLQTWFQAASSGKHVTACTVADLARRGRLALAAPVGDYLPELPPAWGCRSIGSLMNHTSGLPEYLDQGGDTVPTTYDAFVSRYAGLVPVADEGSAWSYSNTNYILLGFLIARVGGVPAGRQMQALLDRCGAGALVASPDWVRGANAGRDSRDGGRDTDSLDRAVIGDGDIAFNAPGAAQWLRTLLGDSLGIADVIFRDSIAPYGCGFFLDRCAGNFIAHHGGHFDGWTAMLLLNRTQQCGVFVLANLAPGNTRAVRAIAQVALEGFRPGSTPLALPTIDDDDPALSGRVRAQMLRAAGPADPDAFAPAMQAVIARAGPVRGVVNLWAGTPPDRFDLVEEQAQSTRSMRRYRLTYPDRVEHLSVGLDADRRIDWAWPL